MIKRNERPKEMRRSLGLRRLGVMILALFAFARAAAAQEVSLGLLQPSLAKVDVPEFGMGQPPMIERSPIEAAPLESAPIEPAPMVMSFATAAAQPAPVEHRFWDRENTFLFATTAALSAADFVVTRDNLREGGRELNPVTSLFSGSAAGLAVNFAGETAGVVGLSYALHKMGHHKLERLVSMVNIGSSAAAVSFDLAHR
jgi:hypothetical protein